MVVAEAMSKPTLKVSVTDSDSSSVEESDSEHEVDSAEDIEADAESIDSEETINEVESGEDNAANADSMDSEESNDDNEVECAEDIEADAESTDSEDSEAEKSVLMTNEGWGDSVAKILGSKKPKNKKTLVLSRAKKHSEIVKVETDEKPSFEVVGELTDKKPDVKSLKTEENEAPPAKKIKHEKASIRQKPKILEKDRERLLAKIATKGVVQLFNAVRNQQKTVEKELDRNDISEVKKDRIMKKFDKRTFLDTLMGKSKSIVVDETSSSLKSEVKDEEKPRWNALRDDFMMGAKLKDWDKESVEE